MLVVPGMRVASTGDAAGEGFAQDVGAALVARGDHQESRAPEQLGGRVTVESTNVVVARIARRLVFSPGGNFGIEAGAGVKHLDRGVGR